MWWMFVRDFYRAGEAGYAPPASMSAQRAAPQPFPAAAAESAHDEQPEATNLGPYLQRLSVDGEHAFGLWDSDAGFSIFSANFERVTALSSNECAGHGWIASIHHTNQYALNEALIQAEQEGRAGQCLVQACRPDGSEWGWLVLDIKPPSKRQPAVMVMLRNVTEAHALDEALKQTEAALSVAERGRSAFLSSMSHELRTPLNAIMGFSEMMKSGVFGPLNNDTYQNYAQHIHESGQLLLNKVDDLLNIASMDAGEMELEEETCNARQLLAEALEMHSHAAFAKRQNLKLDCTGSIQLSGDRAKLICVLSHFVSNALRHSPEGAEITLSARAVPHDGVIFSVRDPGEGIPEQQLCTIRAALQDEQSYMSIEPGGIGLGLALSRELAACHGGRIVVDSIRHRGTVVSLIVPPERVIAGMPQKSRRSS